MPRIDHDSICIVLAAHDMRAAHVLVPQWRERGWKFTLEDLGARGGKILPPSGETNTRPGSLLAKAHEAVNSYSNMRIDHVNALRREPEPLDWHCDLALPPVSGVSRRAENRELLKGVPPPITGW